MRQPAASVATDNLPREHREVGPELLIEYFDEQYPMVDVVDYTPLYDPENLKPRS